MSGLTYQERLQRLNIPTLSYRRVRGDLIEVFKLVTGKYDNDVAEGLLDINPRVSRPSQEVSNLYTTDVSHSTNSG